MLGRVREMLATDKTMKEMRRQFNTDEGKIGLERGGKKRKIEDGEEEEKGGAKKVKKEGDGGDRGISMNVFQRRRHEMIPKGLTADSAHLQVDF